MITTTLEESSRYWTELLAKGYQLYKDTKAELAQQNPDASKIAILVAKNSVGQVENFWQTWGAILNQAAATVVLRMTVNGPPASDTVNVFPLSGLGDLVPGNQGVPLVRLTGAGSGTLAATVDTFDRIAVTATLQNHAVGDLYLGLVYRKLIGGKTRPLANVLVQVV